MAGFDGQIEDKFLVHNVLEDASLPFGAYFEGYIPCKGQEDDQGWGEGQAEQKVVVAVGLEQGRGRDEQQSSV